MSLNSSFLFYERGTFFSTSYWLRWIKKPSGDPLSLRSTWSSLTLTSMQASCSSSLQKEFIDVLKAKEEAVSDVPFSWVAKETKISEVFSVSFKAATLMLVSLRLSFKSSSIKKYELFSEWNIYLCQKLEEPLTEREKKHIMTIQNVIRGSPLK